MILEWHTGNTFEFSYKNLLYFLKENDPELYAQLKTAKKKKKMTYFYLLKYNERHPINTNSKTN